MSTVSKQLLILIIAAFLAACSSGGMDRETRVKYQKYLVQGEGLYKIHCMPCHMEHGGGLALLIPPLKDSDFLLNYPDSSICGIRNGFAWELEVNGKIYNQKMPPHQELTALEIAEITTYIYKEYLGEERLFAVGEVERILENCNWTPED